MAEVSNPLGLSGSLPSEPKASILLVDDGPANLLSLRAILEELGQNLVDARSGEEALQRVQILARAYCVEHDDHIRPGFCQSILVAPREQEKTRSWGGGKTIENALPLDPR